MKGLPANSHPIHAKAESVDIAFVGIDLAKHVFAVHGGNLPCG